MKTWVLAGCALLAGAGCSKKDAGQPSGKPVEAPVVTGKPVQGKLDDGRTYTLQLPDKAVVDGKRIQVPGDCRPAVRYDLGVNYVPAQNLADTLKARVLLGKVVDRLEQPGVVGAIVEEELKSGEPLRQVSVFVERQVTDTVSAQVGYVGSRSSHMVVPIDFNQPQPDLGPVETWRPLDERRPLYPLNPAIGMTSGTDSIGVAAYDAVVGIFVQFVNAEDRPDFFAKMARALKPGGVLLLEGYGPGQLAYGTGGPRYEQQLYSEEMLRSAFADMRIDVLRAYDAIIEEGPAHSGMSALVDLVAVKRG